MRIFTAIVLFLVAAIGVSGQESGADAAATEARAARAYDAGEWAGAHALYMLLTERDPDNPRAYARAIVTAARAGQPDAAPALLERALARSIALDDVLGPVEADSRRLGAAAAYEDFLLRVREVLPWLSRAVDARLLAYYSSCSDPEAMERCARRMLVGLPDSADYLNVLARALLMQGRNGEAVATWQQVLAADADNLEALLSLGSYELDFGDAARGRELLTRAYAIKPTPYLEALLKRER